MRPGPGGQPLPGPGRQRGDQRISALLSPADGEGVAAADRHHIRHVAVFEPAPQVLGLPVDFVGGEPGERHPGLDDPGQHRLGQPGLGRELDVAGDARGRHRSWSSAQDCGR
jgi:hypothetical protein